LYARKLEFTLIEGRNRQIRKMVEAVGLNVVALHRVSFGGIKLKGSSLGTYV
jgi:pseudouridine synthase